VTISLNLEEKGIFRLVYKDNGKAQSKYIRHNEGMGYLIINSMIKQLNGNSNQKFENGYTNEIWFKEKVSSRVQ
jgi:two-component sensor histidine kinase